MGVEFGAQGLGSSHGNFGTFLLSPCSQTLEPGLSEADSQPRAS